MNIIESNIVGIYEILIIKNEKETFGGKYEVQLKSKGRVINSNKGFNLDAAYNVFKNTVNAIENYRYSETFKN